MNEWEWQCLEERNLSDSLCVRGLKLEKGDLVRLRPRPGGDIFDLALAGQTAIIESIEQDYEGKVHLAVVIENDPGKDLGMMRQIGHRFFFAPDEVEPVERAPKILIAGIGNIFFGDDGFGVEVVRRLSALPANVTVRDFGIRSYDLAYALLDGYDVTILVDAAPRGERPGTLYVIEPEIGDDEGEPVQPAVDGHAMDPERVLRMAKRMGEVSKRILLVACEPASLGGEHGEMGLSEVVAATVVEAVHVVEKFVAEISSAAKRETSGSRVEIQR